MHDCNYYGCIYNKLGECCYASSKIKISYYRACDQDDLDSVHASLYGD